MSFFFGAILLLATAGGPPNARARWNLRPAAHHAAPMAHVLRTFHRDRFFLPGLAASIPGLPARLHILDRASTSAATSADLLVSPRAVQQDLQKPVVTQTVAGNPLKASLAQKAITVIDV